MGQEKSGETMFQWGGVERSRDTMFQWGGVERSRKIWFQRVRKTLILPAIIKLQEIL
jgi:hypothetical protein